MSGPSHGWGRKLLAVFPVACSAFLMLNSPSTALAGRGDVAEAGQLEMVAPATIIATLGEEFFSPSKNISCELDWHYAGLPPEAECQTFIPLQSVKISPAGMVTKCSGASCVGNPAENTRALPYLTSIAAGPFLCTSRVDGVACSAADRAFLISKSGIVIYDVLPHTTMQIYAHPSGHPSLSAGTGYGWLVALSSTGARAEVLASCGARPGGKLPAGHLWTVDLSAVKYFEVDTAPANEAAGSVVDVSRSSWVSMVRVDGWNGYFDLGVKSSFLSDGPGASAC